MAEYASAFARTTKDLLVTARSWSPERERSASAGERATGAASPTVFAGQSLDASTASKYAEQQGEVSDG